MDRSALRATVTPSIQFGLGVEMDNGRTSVHCCARRKSCLISASKVQMVWLGDTPTMPSPRYLTSDDYDAIIRLWKQAGLQSVRLRGRDSRDAFAAQLAAGQRVISLERKRNELVTPARWRSTSRHDFGYS